MSKEEWLRLVNSFQLKAKCMGGGYLRRYTEPRKGGWTTKYYCIVNEGVWKQVAVKVGVDFKVQSAHGRTSIRIYSPDTRNE